MNKTLMALAAAAAFVTAAVHMETAHAAAANFAFVGSDETPTGQAQQKFAEIVKAKSGGRLTVNPAPNGKLGSEQQTLADLESGKLELMAGSSALFANAVKEFGLFDLPFLFHTPQEVDAVLDGSVGKTLLDKLEPLNLVGLAYWENGFRHLTNSKKSIEKADDIAGLKIRVIPNPIYVDTFKALGAVPVPMPFPEVPKALEAKKIDGQENPLSIIITSKLYESQKYATLTGHIYAPLVVLASKKWWASLSEQDKAILREAAQESATYQRKMSRELAVRVATKTLKGYGVEVNVLNTDEQQKLQDKVKPVVDKYSAVIGESLVRQARAEAAKAK